MIGAAPPSRNHSAKVPIAREAVFNMKRNRAVLTHPDVLRHTNEGATCVVVKDGNSEEMVRVLLDHLSPLARLGLQMRAVEACMDKGGVKRLGLNLHKTQEQRLPRAAYNSLDQNFATRAAAAARRSSVARIYDVTTKVKLNPPTRELLSSDWYAFALYL
ncbi:unnamed protein product [Pelagomonas calceolata]|uniref:Uncharacterized protein n=1 Tax=Pelagomonas calceolata TaxID=35677 RepID=A0A8J2SGH7_9STRA|nr:unnamed protein product [Pelagomonas calceolata]|mmetsp:Transcript_15134/g.43050  ORF Transcript_15134/g.43050 Transcript_15134/m.43050 type:complete len:160 (-) Transcript_15134:356-835(-)